MDTYPHAYMTIGFLAERYGVSAESLRVWERQGQIPPAARTPGGHRRYHHAHLEALDRMFGTTPVSSDPAGARTAAV